MKTPLLAVTLLGLLFLASQEARAQIYDPYAGQYWDGAQYQPYSQPSDPYYELHTLHYQLYLQQYPGYPVVQTCCFVGAPGWSPVIVTPPQVIVVPRARGFRRR